MYLQVLIIKKDLKKPGSVVMFLKVDCFQSMKITTEEAGLDASQKMFT